MESYPALLPNFVGHAITTVTPNSAATVIAPAVSTGSSNISRGLVQYCTITFYNMANDVPMVGQMSMVCRIDIVSWIIGGNRVDKPDYLFVWIIFLYYVMLKQTKYLPSLPIMV